MSSCSSVETLATPRQGKSLRQRETDKGTSCYRHEVPGPDVGIICHGDHLSELFGIARSWPFTARISKLWISRGTMVRHFSPEQYEV